MEKLKKMAGVTAAQYVKDGMVVGLGTGSTAYFFVEEIGRRMKEEGLKVVGGDNFKPNNSSSRRSWYSFESR